MYSYSTGGSASRQPIMNVVNPRPSSKSSQTQEILSGVPTPQIGGNGMGGALNVPYSHRMRTRHHNKHLVSL